MPKAPDPLDAAAVDGLYIRQIPVALLNAFNTNNRINQYLIDNLPPASWKAKPPDGKGRTIAAIVAHMHNVRVMWLKAGKAEEIPDQLDRTTVSPGAGDSCLGEQPARFERGHQRCPVHQWPHQELPPRCRWLSWLLDLPRRPPPRPDHHARPPARSSPAAKSDVRHVGMGTSLIR